MNDTMIEPLTTEEIEQIRARDAARTPGRWGVGREELDEDFSDEEQDTAMIDQIGALYISGHDDLHTEPPNHERVEADAAWIDHLSVDCPRLLATIDARDKTISERDAEIARLNSWALKARLSLSRGASYIDSATEIIQAELEPDDMDGDCEDAREVASGLRSLAESCPAVP